MLWKEIIAGFMLAGFVGLLGDNFFNALFLSDASGPVAAVENVIVGPVIADPLASSARSGTCPWRPSSGRAGSASAA